MTMERKDVIAEVKELNEKGEGVLRFIRFNQEDKDADITLPGFVGQQKAVLLAAHNWKSDYPPLGHGESFEADGATNFRFRLNMSDERAKAWHSWLKMDRDAGLQQVSYGFSPYADGQERGQKDGRHVRFLKPRDDGSPGAKLHEVSFVVVGSGNDTGVLSVKSTDELLRGAGQAESGPMKESLGMTHNQSIEPAAASGSEASPMRRSVGVHKTATTESVWDASAQMRRVKTGQHAGYYRNIFAWQDAEGDVGQKGTWKFIHHLISVDGEPGPANIRACANYIALLNGKGGTTVHDDDVSGIYQHLAAHLRDAGREVPELRGAENGLQLDDALEQAMWELESVLQRVDGIRELRAVKGRGLADRILKQLDSMQQMFVTLCSLVHIKSLDKPSAVVLAELSAESRHEVWQRRIEEMQDKVRKDTQRAEDEAIEQRVKRWQDLQHRLKTEHAS